MRYQELVLASQSPRRKELLEFVGVQFRIFPSNFNEELAPQNLSPAELAMYLAVEKAKESARRDPQKTSDSIYLGADTVVALGKKVYGKPQSPEHALEMWKELSGRSHRVHTGWGLVTSSGSVVHSSHCTTAVQWIELTNQNMEQAIRNADFHDKAGAYAFQGTAMTWIASIDGSPSNVLGLPIHDILPFL